MKHTNTETHTSIENDGEVFPAQIPSDALIAEDIVAEITADQVTFQCTPPV